MALLIHKAPINTGKHRHAQRGGALLVAMIMIFMLSVMGASSMRGSTLERKMASNAIQTATTFQASESTNEMAINNKDNLTDAINIANIAAVNSGNVNSSQTVSIQTDLQQDIGVESSAVLQYVGDGPAFGFSADTFVAYRFVIASEAAVTAVRSNATLLQGAYRIAPGRN